jgi:repressor LexA
LAPSLPHGHIIRELRVNRGWKQEDLADRAGTTKATISKLERSTMRLSMDWLAKLAKAFDMPIENILSSTRAGPAIRAVPIVGTIPAGNWREAVEDPIGWISAIDVGPNAFALAPQGDSMDKLIPPGAYVVVDPDDTTLRDGKVYAVMNDDSETTVKMFRAEPARLVPMSTNPAHQDFMLGGSPFTIIGRVRSIVQDL